MLKCPQDSFCIDLPDECHPQLGDMYCPGVCYQSGYHTLHSHTTHTNHASLTSTEVFSCGGKAHRSCPAAYHCVDLPDNCFPHKGDKDCDGVCYLAHAAAISTHSKSKKPQSKPVAHHELAHCGGAHALLCPDNYACVDLPDSCNPLTGDENCPGVCYLSAVRSKTSMVSVPLHTTSAAGITLPEPHKQKGKISFCGVHNLKCADGYTCVDLPDHCDPLKGGSKCPGVCYLHTFLSMSSYSEQDTGNAPHFDSSHYTVQGNAALSAMSEYKKHAEQYCHKRDNWSHEKSLWCCQHENIGCPNPAYILKSKSGNPLSVSTVPKSCLFNQCPTGTTTCVPDPHKCKDKTKTCFQYKCEPVESNPLHKAQIAGCSMYTTCQTCTKKYNWQEEQCAWCMQTGKCAPQGSTLNQCKVGARLYANECPVATKYGILNPGSKTHKKAIKTTKTTKAKTAKTTKTTKTTKKKAAMKSASEKKTTTTTAKKSSSKDTKKNSHKTSKTVKKTFGPVGPKGTPGPPGPILEDANIKAAVGSCKNKSPGKDLCSFKLTTGKKIDGICWHNKNSKDTTYCSAKFKARVQNWVSSYKACHVDLAGATCNYIAQSGTTVLGACVPHNFLGTPANFQVLIEKRMGKDVASSFIKMQDDLFHDEEDDDHELNTNDFDDDTHEEEEDKEDNEMADFLKHLDISSMRRKLMSLDDYQQISSKADKKPARLFCASHTGSDVQLWNAALRACLGKNVHTSCGYKKKIGRCVNGNVGSYSGNAKIVKTLYCRPNSIK